MAELKPVARAMDPYMMPREASHSPTQGAGRGWRELAAGLAAIEPGLTRYLTTEFEESVSESVAEGQTLEQQQKEKLALRDAVRRGVIPAGANPYVKLGYIQSELKRASSEHLTAAMAAWESDGQLQNGEPEAVIGWYQKFTAEWTSQNLGSYDNRLLQQHFQPHIDANMARVVNHHIGRSIERNEERRLTSLEQEAAGILHALELPAGLEIANMAAQYGVNPGRFQNVADLQLAIAAKQLEEMAKTAYDEGLSGTKINALLTEQIALAADQTGERSILELGAMVKAGTGTLDGTARYRDMKSRIEERISMKEMREQEHIWRQQERQRAETRRVANNTALKTFLDDVREGRAADPIAMYESIGVDDRQIFDDIMGLSRAINQSTAERSDPEYEREVLYRGITEHDYDMAGSIQAGLQEGRLSPEAARRLLSDQDRRAGLINDPVYSHPVTQQIITDLEAALSVDRMTGLPSTLSLRNAQNARIELEEYATGVMEANPGIPAYELRDKLRPVADQLFKHYSGVVTQGMADVPGIGLRPPLLQDGQQAPQEPQQEPQEPQAVQPTAQQEQPPAAPQEPSETDRVRAEVTARINQALSVNPPGHPRQGFPIPPDAAVQFLLQNAHDPSILNAFDAKYGPGAAAEFVLQMIQE